MNSDQRDALIDKKRRAVTRTREYADRMRGTTERYIATEFAQKHPATIETAKQSLGQAERDAMKAVEELELALAEPVTEIRITPTGEDQTAELQAALDVAGPKSISIDPGTLVVTETARVSSDTAIHGTNGPASAAKPKRARKAANAKPKSKEEPKKRTRKPRKEVSKKK